MKAPAEARENIISLKFAEWCVFHGVLSDKSKIWMVDFENAAVDSSVPNVKSQAFSLAFSRPAAHEHSQVQASRWTKGGANLFLFSFNINVNGIYVKSLFSKGMPGIENIEVISKRRAKIGLCRLSLSQNLSWESLIE